MNYDIVETAVLDTLDEFETINPDNIHNVKKALESEGLIGDKLDLGGMNTTFSIDGDSVDVLFYSTKRKEYVASQHAWRYPSDKREFVGELLDFEETAINEDY